MTNLYVFDFHGVLEKGNENSVREISNLALKNLNYQRELTKKESLKYYGLKWNEIFRKILPKITIQDSFDLYKESINVKSVHPEIILKHTKQNDNVLFVLEKILEDNDEMILISNTGQKSLIEFIKTVNLEKYFNQDNSFGVSGYDANNQLTKKELLKKYLENRRYEKIIIIGDSPGDIELKEVSPDNSITFLYTHKYLDIRECNPNFKIDDLRDIFKHTW